jgi:hypothetical protein
MPEYPDIYIETLVREQLNGTALNTSQQEAILEALDLDTENEYTPSQAARAALLVSLIQATHVTAAESAKPYIWRHSAMDASYIAAAILKKNQGSIYQNLQGANGLSDFVRASKEPGGVSHLGEFRVETDRKRQFYKFTPHHELVAANREKRELTAHSLAHALELPEHEFDKTEHRVIQRLQNVFPYLFGTTPFRPGELQGSSAKALGFPDKNTLVRFLIDNRVKEILEVLGYRTDFRSRKIGGESTTVYNEYTITGHRITQDFIGEVLEMDELPFGIIRQMLDKGVISHATFGQLEYLIREMDQIPRGDFIYQHKISLEIRKMIAATLRVSTRICSTIAQESDGFVLGVRVKKTDAPLEVSGIKKPGGLIAETKIRKLVSSIELLGLARAAGITDISGSSDQFRYFVFSLGFDTSRRDLIIPRISSAINNLSVFARMKK